MDKKELLEKLKKLQGDGDTENQHCMADDLLLEFINDEQISEEYNKINKWYA